MRALLGAYIWRDILLAGIGWKSGLPKNPVLRPNAIEGLYQLANTSGKPVQCKPQIVTLGAVTYFCEEVKQTPQQFLGQMDVLGLLNSRWFVKHIPVPWAWHSLNLALPGHMSVAEALKTAHIH